MARLRRANALLIGVGGIGGHTAMALAAAGIGTLTLVDFDRVDETNLARQILFSSDDVGASKAEVAQRRLRQINPEIRIRASQQRADSHCLDELCNQVDVVIDASDNFATRFAINAAAVRHGITLVSGSAIRWEGQVATFGPDYTSSPCYRCVYSPDDENLQDCQGEGVLASLPGMIGQALANEVLAQLVGLQRPPMMTLVDAQSGATSQLKIQKNSTCPVCGTAH